MTGQPLIEVDTIFGRIEGFQDDLITDHLIAFGAHTRPELAFLLSMVEDGDDVFDIGGHIGTFAIPLAQRVGSAGRILVVEAAPANFAVLTSNFDRIVPAGTIRLHNALIAPPLLAYAMRVGNRNTGASYFMPTTAGDPIHVPTTTLDALCETYFVPRVVKIDIEGFETFALAHAPKMLAQRPIVYAEVADGQLRRHQSSLAELDQLLRSHGYRLFRNIGDRNGRHDDFRPRQLACLAEGGDFFDVLAVHEDDTRLGRLT
jgi:FkbM family methyltransferase